jgi:putative FmdB family regulatory protein
VPIYEYQCRKCEEVFDCITMKIDENFIPKCTKCGSDDVKKLVSSVRYMSGPAESSLAANAQQKLLKTLGGNVPEKTRREIQDLAKVAGARGKRRFESMMDTGKSDNIEY